MKLPKTREFSQALQESGLREKVSKEDPRMALAGKGTSVRNMQVLKDIGEAWKLELTPEEEEFLGLRLEDVVQKEMPQCSLLLAHDLPYRHSGLLHRLLHLLTNSRQVRVVLS